MTEYREYRVLRSGGRGGREPGILVSHTRDRGYADRMVSSFSSKDPRVNVWVETRVVTDWGVLECPHFLSEHDGDED